MVIPGVRLGKAPEHGRLEVRRVDDEPRAIGQVLQRRLAEQVPRERAGVAVADRARQEDPEHDRPEIDRLAGELPDRPHERLVEAAAHAASSKSSRGQASASAPAVIEPPETLEIRSSRGRYPASFSRQSAPTWKSIAR